MKTIVFEVEDYVNSTELKEIVNHYIKKKKKEIEEGEYFKYNLCDKRNGYGGTKPLSNAEIYKESFWNKD